MVNANLQFATESELQRALGDRIRKLRLSRNSAQHETAEKAGISLSALRNLESGRGATTATLLRTLKALDSLDRLESLVPEVKFNPVALLKTRKPQQRVHRPRVSKKAGA
jgi:transcriptional regulator with XRE-family HTH domain